jgi:hypothetical protein
VSWGGRARRGGGCVPRRRCVGRRVRAVATVRAGGVGACRGGGGRRGGSLRVGSVVVAVVVPVSLVSAGDSSQEIVHDKVGNGAAKSFACVLV